MPKEHSSCSMLSVVGAPRAHCLSLCLERHLVSSLSRVGLQLHVRSEEGSKAAT